MNFDENGDPPASFDIINWHVTAQGTIEFVTVGHFVSSQGLNFHIDMDRVVWGGGNRHKVSNFTVFFPSVVSLLVTQKVTL